MVSPIFIQYKEVPVSISRSTVLLTAKLPDIKVVLRGRYKNASQPDEVPVVIESADDDDQDEEDVDELADDEDAEDDVDEELDDEDFDDDWDEDGDEDEEADEEDDEEDL
jgi:hypothetical protein